MAIINHEYDLVHCPRCGVMTFVNARVVNPGHQYIPWKHLECRRCGRRIETTCDGTMTSIVRPFYASASGQTVFGPPQSCPSLVQTRRGVRCKFHDADPIVPRDVAARVRAAGCVTPGCRAARDAAHDAAEEARRRARVEAPSAASSPFPDPFQSGLARLLCGF